VPSLPFSDRGAVLGSTHERPECGDESNRQIEEIEEVQLQQAEIMFFPLDPKKAFSGEVSLPSRKS
jgi:hypothetical protein